MVESKFKRGFEHVVNERKLMTIIILLPNLTPREMARLCQISKACKELMAKYVNFEVLFKA